MTTKFKHDCDQCQFLGHELGHDLYVCGAHMIPGFGPTILARFGNDGPEYASMPWRLIVDAIGQGGVPDPLMAGADAVKEILTNTLLPHSGEFRRFLKMHGTRDLLQKVSAQANAVLRQELTDKNFPYSPVPFLALRTEAYLEEGMVCFGIFPAEATT